MWFAETGAEEKVIDFLDSLEGEGILSKGESTNGKIDDAATSFLDIGTGNGHFLYELRESGWAGYMRGVDYSSPSIKLAKQIGEKRQQTHREKDGGTEESECFAPVAFEEYDILGENESVDRQFDVVLDKGTFDAISLSAETDSSGTRIAEQYRARIKPFLKNRGLLVITSCNWTEQELRAWFEMKRPDEDGFLVLKDRVRYPTFRFGGKEGQSVISLCFEKVVNS